MKLPLILTVVLTAALPTLTVAAPLGRNGANRGGNNAKANTNANANNANAANANAANANTNANANNNANANANANANTGNAAANSAASESTTQAAQNWAKDTGIVSGFLNKAPNLTGQQFTAAAKVALAAEKDELNHKAVLDAASGIGNTASVKSANNVLVNQGTFQDVVDLLQDMVDQGDSVAVTDTNKINAGRCKNVLPNIDKYLAAAGTDLQATRPDACDLTGATQTVSSTNTGTGNANTGTAANTGTTAKGNKNGNANANANANAANAAAAGTAATTGQTTKKGNGKAKAAAAAAAAN